MMLIFGISFWKHIITRFYAELSRIYIDVTIDHIQHDKLYSETCAFKEFSFVCLSATYVFIVKTQI